MNMLKRLAKVFTAEAANQQPLRIAASKTNDIMAQSS